jgi:large subunit ribosomal protein L22
MKRVRPAPMGRAYRYQRRLTHIVLSVAERELSTWSNLVTKVEEPVAEPKAASAAAKKAAAKKAPAAKKPAKKSAKKAAK